MGYAGRSSVFLLRRDDLYRIFSLERLKSWTVIHHVLFILLFIYIYQNYFSPLNAKFFDPLKNLSFLEYVVYLSFGFLFYSSVQKRKFVQTILVSIAILIFMIFIDQMLLYFNRVPRLMDVFFLADALLVMPLTTLAAVFLFLFAVGVLAYVGWQSVLSCPGERLWEKLDAWLKMFFSWVIGFFFAILLSFAFQYVSKNVLYKIAEARCGYCVLPFSDLEGVEKNGRFSVFFLRNVESVWKNIKLMWYDNMVDVHQQLYPGDVIHKRNVYIVMMESFIDPRRLDVAYDRSPLSEEMQALLKEQGTGDFPTYRTSIYGGNSVQTAFELLTGVPAYQKITPVAYDMLLGKRTFSLPWRLRDQGYKTLAVVAATSKFFNEPLALRSLGFDHPVFLGDDLQRFPKTKGDEQFFDGDLFKYGLQLLEEARQRNPGPYLIYMEGFYGHIPYHRNKALRPDVVHPKSANPMIADLANNFYYRTQALARFIRRIQAQDPQALIIIGSDHLPPLEPSRMVLKDGEKYKNILLVIDGKRILSFDKYIRAYEVPWLVWDKLTGTTHSRPFDEDDLEAFHFSVLKAGRVGIPQAVNDRNNEVSTDTENPLPIRSSIFVDDEVRMMAPHLSQAGSLDKTSAGR